MSAKLIFIALAGLIALQAVCAESESWSSGSSEEVADNNNNNNRWGSVLGGLFNSWGGNQQQQRQQGGLFSFGLGQGSTGSTNNRNAPQAGLRLGTTLNQNQARTGPQPQAGLRLGTTLNQDRTAPQQQQQQQPSLRLGLNQQGNNDKQKQSLQLAPAKTAPKTAPKGASTGDVLTMKSLHCANSDATKVTEASRSIAKSVSTLISIRASVASDDVSDIEQSAWVAATTKLRIASDLMQQTADSLEKLLRGADSSDSSDSSSDSSSGSDEDDQDDLNQDISKELLVWPSSEENDSSDSSDW